MRFSGFLPNFDPLGQTLTDETTWTFILLNQKRSLWPAMVMRRIKTLPLSQLRGVLSLKKKLFCCKIVALEFSWLPYGLWNLQDRLCEACGEQPVHGGNGMVDLIGQQLCCIDAAARELLPFPIHIAHRYRLLRADGFGGIHIAVKCAVILGVMKTVSIPA